MSPTIKYDAVEEFERKVEEAIDASTEYFNILQYGEQDMEDAAENVTYVLEGRDHDLTYEHIDEWVCRADRRNYDLPTALQHDAIDYVG